MIDNNLARAEVETDVRIVGTPYEPGLTGRFTSSTGPDHAQRAPKEVDADRDVPRRPRVVPSIDLVLNTRAKHDVRIAVTGTPGKTETT
jgi:hypothetical protein